MAIEQAPNTGSTGSGGFVLSMPRYNAGVNQTNAKPSQRKDVKDETGIGVDFFAGAEGINNFGGFAIDTPEYQEYQAKVMDLSDFVNKAVEKRYDPRVVDMGNKDSWEINKEYRQRMNELKQLGNKLHFAKSVEQEMMQEGMLYNTETPIGSARYMGAVGPNELTGISEQLSKGVSNQPYETGIEYNSAVENYNAGIENIDRNYQALAQQFAGNPVALQQLQRDRARAMSQLQRPTEGAFKTKETAADRMAISLEKEAISRSVKESEEIEDWLTSYAIVEDGGNIALTSSIGDKTVYPFSKVIVDTAVQPSTATAFATDSDGENYKRRPFDKITLDNLILVPVTKSGRVYLKGDVVDPKDPVVKFEVRSSGTGVETGKDKRTRNVTLPASNLLEKLSGAKKKALRIRMAELQEEADRRNDEIKSRRGTRGTTGTVPSTPFNPATDWDK
jgi:hypothetical protein